MIVVRRTVGSTAVQSVGSRGQWWSHGGQEIIQTDSASDIAGIGGYKV